jgi:hypothetical protein
MRSSVSLSLLALLTLAACGNETGSGDNTPDGSGTLDAGDVEGSDEDVTIEFDIDVPLACDEEDELAPNQTVLGARRLGRELLDAELFLCDGTEDWFRVEVGAGRALSVSVEPDDAQAELTALAIPTDADGDSDAAVAEAYFSPEQQYAGQWFATEATTVDVVVFGDAGLYNVIIAAGCATDAECGEGLVCSLIEGGCIAPLDPLCGDDAEEANNTPSTASQLDLSGGVEQLDRLNVCEEDDDYFTFTLAEPTGVTITAEFDPENDLDVYVFDANGVRVAAAATADQNPEVLALPAFPAGTYTIAVDNYVTGLGLDVGYSLMVETSGGACESDTDCESAPTRPLCLDGACVPFEPETPSGPGGPCDDDGDCDGGLGCYAGADGFSDNFCTAGCNGDGDCEFFGEQGQCVDLFRNAVCFDGCEADTDCPLPYACDTDTNRCELIGCGVDSDCGEGRFCRRTEQQNFGYCTDVPVPVCAEDDENEPNDTSATATPIEGDGTVERGAMICNENDDWYVFEVAEASAVEVSVDFETDVDIDVFVFDAAGTTIGSGTEPDARPEVAEADFVQPGPLFVRVNQFPGDSEVATTYDLSIDLRSRDCRDDAGVCDGVTPLRIECDAETGACVNYDGGGEVALGGECDSDDDCDGGDGVFCWVYEPATEERNICTTGCRSEDDCADIEGTSCVQFGRGFAVCLPE